jgi:hypothetical protein
MEEKLKELFVILSKNSSEVSSGNNDEYYEIDFKKEGDINLICFWNVKKDVWYKHKFNDDEIALLNDMGWTIKIIEFE